MSRENEDRETYLENEIRKMEMELDRMRKVAKDLYYELTYLEFLQNGVTRVGFSQTQADYLISNSRKKIASLSRQLVSPEYPLNEPILAYDDIPKASDVAPEGGPSFRPAGRGNMGPSDDVDDEMKKTYQGGESTKSGGVDDDDA